MSGGDALVIAVDCSTTAAKAVIYDEAGQSVAQAAQTLSTLQPRPAWHEQDAEQWWTATQGAIAEAVGALVDPGRVRALCITHQRESFVCLDSGGRALRPAILWLDGRAHEEIAELGSTRVHELSGKPPDTTPAIYKLAWLARHEPAVLRNAVHVGDVQAYLVWRLTGRWATSHGSADTLGLFDLQRMDWSAELLDLAGVRVEQLPDLVPAGDEIGTLSPLAQPAGRGARGFWNRRRPGSRPGTRRDRFGRRLPQPRHFHGPGGPVGGVPVGPGVPDPRRDPSGEIHFGNRPQCRCVCCHVVQGAVR